MKWWSALLLGAALVGPALSGGEPKVEDYAGKQIELCMIGDSITWAELGDCWRKFLLIEMPELAFMGTHTAKDGYSHAGEGGNTTGRVLARIDSKASVPDSRYYHVLIGVNDNSGARKAEDVPARARKTVDAIVEIIRHLEARPCTEKIFLGSLLPCGNPNNPEDMKYRDAANQEANKILRAEFQKLFPSGKVVWVEYENSLRPMPNWRSIIRLHPNEEGYTLLAKMLADVLKAETVPPTAVPAEKYGVEVTNLWSSRSDCTAPLIPGWYVASFDVDEVEGDTLKFTIESRFPRSLKTPYKKDFSVKVEPGKRAEVEFFTGYQGYGYDQCSMVIRPENGKISKVLVEKMRPTRKASIYGEGCYVDTDSPMSLGEKLVPAN